MAGSYVIKPSVQIRFHPLLALRMLLNPQITKIAMVEEINAVAKKGRTQIRRSLANQTKISYGRVSDAVTLRPAYVGRLSATIRVSDKVPTLGRFMTSYTTRPKSWRKKGWHQTMRLRVWAGSQRFPVRSGRPFVIPGTKLIAVRTGAGKLPIKILSGPNLAGGKEDTGEIQRGQTKRVVQSELPVIFANQIMARINRIVNRP